MQLSATPVAIGTHLVCPKDNEWIDPRRTPGSTERRAIAAEC